MKECEKISIIMIDEEGHLFGRASYKRLENAKWYQKIWAKISPKYRESLIDLMPLESSYKGNGTYEIEL